MHRDISPSHPPPAPQHSRHPLHANKLLARYLRNAMVATQAPSPACNSPSASHNVPSSNQSQQHSPRTGPFVPFRQPTGSGLPPSARENSCSLLCTRLARESAPRQVVVLVGRPHPNREGEKGPASLSGRVSPRRRDHEKNRADKGKRLVLRRRRDAGAKMGEESNVSVGFPRGGGREEEEKKRHTIDEATAKVRERIQRRIAGMQRASSKKQLQEKADPFGVTFRYDGPPQQEQERTLHRQQSLQFADAVRA